MGVKNLILTGSNFESESSLVVFI